jgi:hypothetical protein
MNETKKVYVKPAIEGVYLLPDEAVLGVCKTDGAYGPIADDCVSGTTICPSLTDS